MFYDWCMRTTLTIDADVLSAARDLAMVRQVSIGKIISELARDALTKTGNGPTELPESFFGITPLPRRGVVVSNDLINSIRDDEGI